MPAIWRTVRVFISSTFRDMHAERDYLVKVVFPALRENLEEIDHCRPFFVGILGERYGWAPRTFSEKALSKYGWVQHQTGKSVTELEILYGVLRNPGMHAHALFLFRDPGRA